MDRRTLLGRGALVASLGLAGCTGSPDGTASPTDEPAGTATDTQTGTDGTAGTTTETSTAAGTPTATETATASPTAAGEPDQRVVVAPDDNPFRFSPESFTISSGDTVLWEWANGGHNVSPESQPDEADWPGKDEVTYSAGTTYRYTFEVAGEYRYHCDPHQSNGMRGSFTVE